MMRLLALTALCACAPIPPDAELPLAPFEPPLFVFQNGVDFGSFEQEAETLRALGYDGLGSVKLPSLAERLAAYDAAHVRIFSIYVSLGDEGIPGAIELLAGRDALVELTVRRPRGPQTVRAVQEVADLAAAAGLRVALYPHAGFTVQYIPDALELIEQVKRPNLGLMFNLCHFLKGEHPEDLEGTIERAAAHVFAASTCGADTQGQSWGELIRPLDSGTFDQQRLLGALERIGFRGAVGLQCYAVKGDKRENLRRSMVAWREALETLNGS